MNKVVIAIIIIIFILICMFLWNYKLCNIIFQNLKSQEIVLDTNQKWSGGVSYEEVQYSDVSDSDYVNIYVPNSDKPVPLLVLVHGGGFVMNDLMSRQTQLMIQYFRDQGYACATINYRLAQEAEFPAAIQDVKAAIRFLKVNASTYGYDTDKIAIWGESAGAYIATMVAVTDDNTYNDLQFIGEDDQKQKVSASVNVLLDFYGTYDFKDVTKDFESLGIPQAVVDVANSWIPKDLIAGYDNLESYWLRSNISEMTDETYNKCNPYYYMDKNPSIVEGLKIYITHGDADITVPYIQSSRLNSYLEPIIEKNNLEYKLLKNLKHGDDRFYTDDQLDIVKEFLNQALN